MTMTTTMRTWLLSITRTPCASSPKNIKSAGSAAVESARIRWARTIGQGEKGMSVTNRWLRKSSISRNRHSKTLFRITGRAWNTFAEHIASAAGPLQGSRETRVVVDVVDTRRWRVNSTDSSPLWTRRLLLTAVQVERLVDVPFNSISFRIQTRLRTFYINFFFSSYFLALQTFLSHKREKERNIGIKNKLKFISIFPSLSTFLLKREIP